ncbi:MAG: IS1595 family transposase [Candidatus Sulfotelmatobacter sp.]
METTDGNSEQSGAVGPRANALQHGLTATTLLPSILRAGRLDEIDAELQAEYCPQTVTEELLVREIARHAAALEITEQAEPAVMRTAALAFSQVASLEQAAPLEDLRLTAAVTAEPLDRAARYRRTHEKALHQALDKLRLWQTAGPATRPDPAPDWTEKFTSETGCEAYLHQRFSSNNWHCPQCRQKRGHWLSTRRRWECSHCGAQIGLRHGTVFEHSQLPLAGWFLGIRAFAGRTAITARELMALTGIERPATARAMLKRIRRALHENDLAMGLAGLTAYPLSTDVLDAQSAKLRNEKIRSAPTDRIATVDRDATSATNVRLKAHLNQASQPSKEGDLT